MGATVCDAVAGDPALELVAAVDPHAVGREHGGLTIDGSVEALAGCAEVVVDFTVAAAARETLPWLAAHGIHAVVGTTGLTADDLDALRPQFTSSNCIIAANFAISAVLMMRFAELAAPYFDTAEIIELHHDRKIDAPSGTAVATARADGRGLGGLGAGPDRDEVLSPGARGSEGPGGIRVHAVRMRGMVAHQEVILGADGPDADDPPGQLRPVQLHARRPAGLQAHRRSPRSHRRPRRVPVTAVGAGDE